jgi:signal transduction histidine kinase/ActR/RegA family two-component response regulator
MDDSGLLSSVDRRRVAALTAFGVAAVGAILVRLALHDFRNESGLFHPHGYCYLWMPSLVATHVISDSLIGFSYVAISLTIAWLVWRARHGLPFSWIFIAFGAFIVACGATHFMEVWTLWQPLFWLSADVKIVTAIASVATALVLPPLVPRVLDFIHAARVSEARRIELERTQAELEQRVRERTADLANALQHAEEANRAKEAFLATVSHELRTPLNAILGWADILERRPDPSLLQRGLPVIIRNAQAQARVVGDLVDVSSIASGKMRLEPKTVDLSAVIMNTVVVVGPTADAKRLTMNVAVNPSIVVWGDPARLQQIIWNLLSNAIKFTPEGGSIQVAASAVDGNARLEVADTGVGIDSRFLQSVFDRFSQADTSTTRGYPGLGLGLAVVRHLVELHGGSVRAESAGAGRGSTFTVEIPLQLYGRLALEEGDAEADVDLHGLRVLVIDDDPDSRETVSMILEAAGAAITRADSANSGLKRMREGGVDVIVSDIGMPERDGFAFIHDVRRHPDPKLRQTPAVALTAFARDEDRRRILSAGYQKHVPKPVTASQLVQSVASVARTSLQH